MSIAIFGGLMRRCGVVVCLLLLTASPVWATIYYIDFVGGADTNAGTSTGTAWKRAPGMATCSNTCAATTPVAGDRFIFKGGVSWTNAVFTWNISWNGSVGNVIYFGVDATWFTGGGWARPILNAGGLGAGANNNMVSITGNYVTLDNFEFTGMQHQTDSFGNNNHIKINAATNTTIKNSYFHGWVENGTLDTLTVLIASTPYPALNTNATFDYNTVDGFDSASVMADPNCSGACKGSVETIFGSVPIVSNNTVRYVSNGFVGAFDQTYGNTIEKIRDSVDVAVHENAFENNRACNAKFYNNIVRTIKAGVTVTLAEQTGCTAQIYNNLIYDTTAGNVLWIDIPTPYGGCTPDAAGKCDGGSAVIYQNTIECGPDSSSTNICIQVADGSSSSLGYDTAVTAKNNHFITSNANPIADTLGGACATCTTATNVTQTKAAANAQNYTMANAFLVLGQSNATVDVGTDLSGVGIAGLLTAVNNVTRPSGSAWDVGAYEWIQASGGGGVFFGHPGIM